MNITSLRLYLVLTLLAVSTGMLSACGGNLEETSGTSTVSQPVQPVTVIVNILGNRMDPQIVTIPIGSTVIFHNTTSADHGIISDVFDADLRPGQDYQYTFTYGGIFRVRSRTHIAAENLRCEIRVE